jgi:3'-5' exoribonuclease-like protein
MPKPLSTFDDFMLDLETLGTRPGCVVMSIGLVPFGPGRVGPVFYEEVHLESCKRHGLHVDADTEAWWGRQAPAARVLLDRVRSEEALPLGDALAALTAAVMRSRGSGRPSVWANGASFDIPIIEEAYRVAGMAAPWGYGGHRCYRTLRAMVPAVEADDFAGVAHNAGDDALHQARHAAAILLAREMALAAPA